MATIRVFTTIEQSRKLAEILPLESADMYYWKRTWKEGDYAINVGHSKDLQEGFEAKGIEYVPCWSLASLLSVLPNNEHIETAISRGSWKTDPFEYLPNTWWCEYEDTKNQTDFSTFADNPVDACVAMIEKLHENNLL